MGSDFNKEWIRTLKRMEKISQAEKIMGSPGVK
jgi:hypothetical protein